MSIAAVTIVYNEESRIEAALKSVAWCDEIIVVDRNSSDRTREIAARYTDKIFTLESREFSPKDNLAWLSRVSAEWVLAFTASDVMHPELAAGIRKLTSDPAFQYDVIHIPFRRYVVGLETPRSPWYSELNPHLLYRKSVAKVNPDSVHGAITLASGRHYKMPNSERACMFHLTHSSVDVLMDRHMIYWRAEARLFPEAAPLSAAFKDVLRGLYVTLFRRRTFLMGWDGIALMMAYLSYFMMRFVYIWEKRSSRAPETYARIRADVEKAWAAETALKKDK